MQLYCPFWLLLPDLFLSYQSHCNLITLLNSLFVFACPITYNQHCFITQNSRYIILYFLFILNKIYTQNLVKNYSYQIMFDLIVAEHHLKIQSKEYLWQMFLVFSSLWQAKPGFFSVFLPIKILMYKSGVDIMCEVELKLKGLLRS